MRYSGSAARWRRMGEMLKLLAAHGGACRLNLCSEEWGFADLEVWDYSL